MNLNYKIPNVISWNELRKQSPVIYGKLITQLNRNRVTKNTKNTKRK